MNNEEFFDPFPVNILESNGTIDRKGFNFQCTKYKIWSNGKVIQQNQESFAVLGNISNRTLTVYIRSNIFSQYTYNEFYFEDISSNGDRILWINSNQNVSEMKKPTALSLFFRNSILSRISLTIDVPQILIEFDGQPSSSFNKAASFVNPISKGRVIDLGNIQKMEFRDETVAISQVEWNGYFYKIVINCIPKQSDMVMIPNYAASRQNIPHIICKDEDFWNDIVAFFSFYHESDDFFTGLYNSVIGVLSAHVEKYERLVDTDIFTISSEFIIFVCAIYEGRLSRKLQEKEKNILFNNCLDFAIKRFGDCIYKTKYRMTSLGMESYLEKMD